MRKENWQKDFSSLLMKKVHEPFGWGKNDCIIFGAQVVETITGEDFYSQYLGYESKKEADVIIKKNGGVEKLISKHLGRSFENVLFARRGDLVLMHLPQKTIGVVDDTGEKIACLSESGLIRLPLKKAVRFWRVG